MLKKLLVVVASLVILLVALVTSRPSRFEIERAGYVNATPDAVYAQLTDFGRWAAWSPWEKLDPGMKRAVTGAPGTVGHTYAWEGNRKVGEGSMTITALSPPGRVEIRLEFRKPMRATDTTVFTVRPDGTGSRVTWAMSGDQGPVEKAFSLFMNMDKMVGAEFEQGLASLAAVTEREQLHAAAPAP